MVFAILTFSYVLIGHLSFSEFLQKQKSIVSNNTASICNTLENSKLVVLKISQNLIAQRDLFSTNPSQISYGKIAVFREMGSMCALDPQIGFIFAFKPGEFLIVNSSDAEYDTIILRDYINEFPFDQINLLEWNLVNINDKTYLAYIQYNAALDIYTGNFVLSENLIGPLVNAIGKEYILSIIDNGGNTTILQEGEHSKINYTFKQNLAYGLRVDGEIPYTYGELFSNYALAIFSILGLLCLTSLIVQSVIIRVHTKPIITLSTKLRNINDDLRTVDLSVDSHTAEVFEIKSAIQHLLDEIVTRRLDAYKHQIKEQESELLFLRSQLRPHFYINAITTIDAMVYQNKLEDVHKFLNSLSVYMRYMMHTEESTVTLGEEIHNIEAYITMQKIRYPEKIVTCIQIPNLFMSRNIPRLTLYTVVENSIKHAMGEKTLFLVISAERTEDGFCVTVEDNGKGYDEKTLTLYNAEYFQIEQDQKSGHIGLLNVKRTLELTYGKQNLLCLKNSESHGAITELYFLDSPINNLSNGKNKRD